MKIREVLGGILASGSTADHRRPVIGKGNESNVKGLHIIGDLAGALGQTQLRETARREKRLDAIGEIARDLHGAAGRARDEALANRPVHGGAPGLHPDAAPGQAPSTRKTVLRP